MCVLFLRFKFLNYDEIVIYNQSLQLIFITSYIINSVLILSNIKKLIIINELLLCIMCITTNGKKLSLQLERLSVENYSFFVTKRENIVFPDAKIKHLTFRLHKKVCINKSLIHRISRSDEAVQGSRRGRGPLRLASNGKKRARKREGISDTPRAKSVWHASHVSRLCTSLDVHRLGGLSLSGQAPRHRFEREEKKLSIRGVEDWHASGMGLAGTEGGRGPVRGRGWTWNGQSARKEDGG